VNTPNSKALWRQERATINRELAALWRKINKVADRIDLQKNETLARLWADPEGAELMARHAALRACRDVLNKKVRDGSIVATGTDEDGETVWFNFDSLAGPRQ
jgi:hypothetical protein